MTRPSIQRTRSSRAVGRQDGEYSIFQIHTTPAGFNAGRVYVLRAESQVLFYKNLFYTSSRRGLWTSATVNVLLALCFDDVNPTQADCTEWIDALKQACRASAMPKWQSSNLSSLATGRSRFVSSRSLFIFRSGLRCDSPVNYAQLSRDVSAFAHSMT